MPDADDLEAARRAAALAMEDLSRHDSYSPAAPPLAGFPALVRHCVWLLPYLDAGDPGLAARCRLRLLDSLRGVLSRVPSPSLLPAIEVFAENLVFDAKLRTFFANFDRAVPEGSRVFTVAPRCGDELHTILELACSHFISSLEDEGGFQAFLSALSWSGNDLQGSPQIGFQEALALTYRTRLFSLPEVVQAHLLLLASRCISGPDLGSHLLAFEDSMHRYVDYLPALGVFNRTTGVKAPLSCLAVKKPFACCIKEVTDQKLKNQVDGLLSFCQAHFGDNLPISESDIFDSSNRLIEESQHMLHEKFRQEAMNVVRRMLSNVLHCAKQKEVLESDAEVTEEVICLPAVLRLMGSLLQQILHHFSQMRAAGDHENASHVARCMEYSFLCDTICLLKQYEANELHRCDLVGSIGQSVYRERASIQMLVHFASISVFCLRRRFGSLWKLCIIMMMMAINLVFIEEDSMDMFRFLIDASKESADNPHTENSNLRVYVRRRSSRVIALRLESLQNLSAETANGRAFLSSHPEYKTSWSDLDDFIECKQGKDYSNSLYQRDKFRSTFKVERFLFTKKTTRVQDMQFFKRTKRKEMPRRYLLAGS